MRLFVDIDGVLTNFVGAALARHNRRFEELAPGEWHFNKALGLTETAFWAQLGGADFWANMDWLPDGRAILGAAECSFGAENVSLLTSPSQDSACWQGKAQWVAKHLPQYNRRLTVSACKTVFGGAGKVLVDDSEDNCEKWDRAGGEAILVPRFWNAGHAQAADAATVVARALSLLLPV